MKMLKTYLSGLLLVVVLWSCREVYYPEEINSTAQIPVIEGVIIENRVPAVTLYWALGYKDQDKVSISNARVTIWDNLGNSADLAETEEGYYTLYTNEITGTAGRTYTLQVELPDGSEYTSNEVPLLKNPEIDSLYATPEIATLISYNSYDEPIASEQEGLSVFADLSGNADSVLYYRFNTVILVESTYTIWPSTPGAKTVFVWETQTLDNIYSVNNTVTHNERQLLLEHPVGFLPFIYDRTLESEEATAPFIAAWIATFNVYSISADVYDYYNSMARQLNAQDQIFAPVPSQVKSNIRCTSDPGKAVIGIFEASSVSTIYKAFGWKNMEVYYYRDLVSYPQNLGKGSIIAYMPDFWISF